MFVFPVFFACFVVPVFYGWMYAARNEDPTLYEEIRHLEGMR